MQPKGIVVHYVGNAGSSAEANRQWFEGGAGGAHTSAHNIIGLKGEILQIIPWWERAQHAGKSYAVKYDSFAKTNNSTLIGIECCHPLADGKFNEATYKSLIDLCAHICKQYGFDPAKDVYRHYDVSGKMCPLYYANHETDWVQIKKDIVAELEKEKAAAKLVEKFAATVEKTVEVPVEKPAVATLQFTMDGIAYIIEAGLEDDSYITTIAEIAKIKPLEKVKLREILSVMGYEVMYDEPTKSVEAHKTISK
jgi:N-acetylmuramoyl-L-alanine amidase CwlA